MKEGNHSSATHEISTTTNSTKQNNENATTLPQNRTCKSNTLSENNDSRCTPILPSDDTRTKSPVKEDTQNTTDPSSFALWMCAQMFQWCSYGYNALNFLLKSGKCPVPWVSAARFHCNVGKISSEYAEGLKRTLVWSLFRVLWDWCWTKPARVTLQDRTNASAADTRPRCPSE